MSIHQLVLFPTNPYHPVDLEMLETHLIHSGFLGAKGMECDAPRFQPGQRFLEWIIFGHAESFFDAAPHMTGWVQVSRVHPRSRCSIELTRSNVPADGIGGMVSELTEDPRCPHCHIKREGWADALASCWSHTKGWERLFCDSCQKGGLPWEWDWAHTAGFSRIWLEVNGIRGGEANPSTALLDALAGWSGVSWTYCFVWL